jgi:hypothetical protein
MTARKVYRIEEDLKPYLHPFQPWGQQIALPNLVEITDPLEALREIGYRKQQGAYNTAAKLPPRNPKFPSQYPEYCNLYAGWRSGGAWDGTGILLTTNEHPGNRVFKFALCVHEKTEEGHHPNHSRGWHPGHCKHCNMDMSVDSGD